MQNFEKGVQIAVCDVCVFFNAFVPTFFNYYSYLSVSLLSISVP